MPVGSAVRRMLGRFEPAAIGLYRGMFIDLDCLAATVAWFESQRPATASAR